MYGGKDLLPSHVHRHSSLLCNPYWKPSGLLQSCFASWDPSHLQLRQRMIILRPSVPGALLLAADSKWELRVCCFLVPLKWMTADHPSNYTPYLSSITPSPNPVWSLGLVLVQFPYHLNQYPSGRDNVPRRSTYSNPSIKPLLCPATFWKNFRHHSSSRLQPQGSHYGFHHAGGCLNLCKAAQGEPPPEIDFSAVKPLNQLIDCHSVQICLLWRDGPYNISFCVFVYMYMCTYFYVLSISNLSLHLYLYFCIHVYVWGTKMTQRNRADEKLCPCLLRFYSVGYGKSSKPQLAGWVW